MIAVISVPLETYLDETDSINIVTEIMNTPF